METERRRENQRTRFVLLHLPAHKSKAAVYKKKNSKYNCRAISSERVGKKGSCHADIAEVAKP